MAHLRDVRVDALPATVASNLPTDGIVAAEVAAYERGLAEGLARSEERIANVVSEAAEAISAVRAQWSAQCLERLSAELKGARAGLEERLSHELARALRPFIADKQLDRIRSSFVGLLRELIPPGSECQLVVSGPAAEERAVMECLCGVGLEALYRTHEDRALRASIGPTVVSADLDAWLNRVLVEQSEADDV